MMLDYDDDADVLYIVYSATKERCSFTETSAGNVLRVDRRTGEIVGCTIPFFRHRAMERGAISIPEIDMIPTSPGFKVPV